MVIYSVIQKRVFTPLRDLPTRIIEAIDHSSNSTMAFAFTKNPRIFCKCKCHCWVWRMVDSLYYSSRKISERCENSFVNYRIYYQKLCYSLRRIWTKPLCRIHMWPVLNSEYGPNNTRLMMVHCVSTDQEFKSFRGSRVPINSERKNWIGCYYRSNRHVYGASFTGEYLRHRTRPNNVKARCFML